MDAKLLSEAVQLAVNKYHRAHRLGSCAKLVNTLALPRVAAEVVPVGFAKTKNILNVEVRDVHVHMRQCCVLVVRSFWSRKLGICKLHRLAC